MFQEIENEVAEMVCIRSGSRVGRWWSVLNLSHIRRRHLFPFHLLPA